VEENCRPRCRAGTAKRETILYTSSEEVMTVLPNSLYCGHQKVTEEEDDQRYFWKRRSKERNVDSPTACTAVEYVGGGTRHCCTM